MSIRNCNNKLAQLRELKKPTMTQVLSNLLDEEIDGDDNLFAHGLNSLKVVQFVSRMRRLGQFLNCTRCLPKSYRKSAENSHY